MTDKELLELAAKAAGFNGDFDENEECMILHYYDENGLLFKDWNPLTEDGDALRLAVKLGMEITIFLSSRRTAVYQLGTTGESQSEDHKQDSYAATRRAIVRAAAAIGKTK